MVKCSIGPYTGLETIYCWSSDSEEEIKKICKQQVLSRLNQKPFGKEIYTIIERKDEKHKA